MIQKIFKNKRGEDMIVDFWAILIFAIIVILFLILFSYNKSANENKLSTEFENKDANFILQSFLRAPAINYDTSKTVADIIAEDDAKKDFTRTVDLFHRYFQRFQYTSGNEVNDIMINIDGKKYKMVTDKGIGFGKVFLAVGGVVFENNNAYTVIPGYDNKRIYVSLRVSETVVIGEYKDGAEEDTKNPNSNGPSIPMIAVS